MIIGLNFRKNTLLTPLFGTAPLAKNWADPTTKKTLDWITVTGKVNLGDVVAGAYPYVDATGHVVIVTGSGYVSVMGTVNSRQIGDNGFANNMVNVAGLHDGKIYTHGIIKIQ
jgi:hypothetical protein